MTLIEVHNINGGTELVRLDQIESIGLPDEKMKGREEFWQGWIRLLSGRAVSFASTDEAERVVAVIREFIDKPLDSPPSTP